MHEFIGETALITGGLVTIATAVGLAWKKVLRPLAHVVVKVEETLPLLDDIRAEFRNNGGSSLKDAVDRIEHNARNARQAIDLHIKQAESDKVHGFRRIHDLEASVSEMIGLVNTLIGITREQALRNVTQDTPQVALEGTKRRKG